MTKCGYCKVEIRPNDGQYPNRGPWLDGIDWSVCDWTYRQHTPEEEPPQPPVYLTDEDPL